MSCPQIWNIEKEKDREKENVGRHASEAQRDKEKEGEEKKITKETSRRNNMKLCIGDEKMINASGLLGENERQ